MAIMCLFRDSGSVFSGPTASYVLIKYLESEFSRIPEERRTEIEQLNREIDELRRSLCEGSGSDGEIWVLETDKNLRRKTKPQVLNPEARAIVKQAIDTNTNKHKYISGVLSYSFKDTAILAANPHIEAEFRALLEDFAFAGIKEEDRLIYWVRHTDKDRVENHFVLPQIVLSTGRHYNPFPPGSQYQFNVFRDYFNLKYGLDDPSAGNNFPDKHKFFRPIHPGTPNSEDKEKAILNIYEKLKGGKLTYFGDVYAYIRSPAFENETGLRYPPAQQTRFSLGSDQSAAYVTLLNKKGQSIRLKGFALSAQFSKERLLTSRVEDARNNAQARGRVLQEMRKEMDAILEQRRLSNSVRAYSNDTKTERVKEQTNEESPSLPALKPIAPTLAKIQRLVNFRVPVDVPEISDHMSAFEKEQALAAQRSAVAYIESKRLREKLTLSEYMEIFRFIAEQIKMEKLHDFYPGNPSKNADTTRAEALCARVHQLSERLGNQLTAFAGSLEQATHNLQREAGHLGEATGSVAETSQRFEQSARTMERQIAAAANRQPKPDNLTP